MSISRRRRPRSAAAIAAVAFVALSVSAAPIAAVAEEAAADPASTAVVEMTPALKEKIQKKVESFRTTHGLPGLSVAVVTPDPAGSSPVITTFAAGQPVPGSATPVDASTQFELGSETKVFTADLLSYLVASGRVSLDDAVQLYAPAGITVPEWADPQTGTTTPITLRDLATHQAGLPDVPPNFQDGCGSTPGCENPHPGYTQTMLWDAIAQQSLLWQPGTRWLYSNWGFGLLGTILANVVEPVPASQPPAYQSAIDGAFLDALGMSSTMIETPGPRLAPPYMASGEPTYYWDNTNAISGAGGLISDAADMGTWVAAHLGYIPPAAPLGVQTMANTLEPVSTITTLCSSPSQCQEADFQMGLGWQLYSARSSEVGAPWAFKNGGTAGSSTDTALAPSLRTGVTTMFNMQRVGDEQLAVPILALLVADRRGPAPTPSHDPDRPHKAEDDARTPHKATLADTGYAASDFIAPGLVAAALLAVGGVLALSARRRTPGTDPGR
ncbi:serine hydrolase domain-containing protein [Compostimonas suwonensis]|nr:serine hydrolase domain-containing protein [Compostimonas suwonensis]